MALGLVALIALPGAAAAKDRNHDRIPDRWEKRHKLSLKVKQAGRDQDRDHLRNLGEFRQGTSPRDADSDDDGLRDGKEHGVGNDPTDEDSDGDGVEDGDENAGTIASFDGTTLTIDLAAGGSISGLVTERTKIKCRVKDDDPDPQPTRKRSGSGHEGGDDDGEDDDGDDDGDDHGRGHGDGGDCDDDECGVEDLVEGTAVHEAVIQISGDGAVFKGIKLIKNSTS
ncbi:MAG: hypothetical protein ACXWZM_05310 [Solirubrobacterales bacterium]